MKAASLAVVLFGLIGFFGQSESALADEPEVIIHFRSGGQATGAIDSRTTSQRLWLRQQQGAIVLVRPFSWDQVASLHEAKVAGTVRQAQPEPNSAAATFAALARRALFGHPADRGQIPPQLTGR